MSVLEGRRKGLYRMFFALLRMKNRNGIATLVPLIYSVLPREHRISHEPSGALKEIRPGTYRAGKADDEPHTEGGGDEDVIILFSLRPYDGHAPIYEVLDDNPETVGSMNSPTGTLRARRAA